MIDWTREDFVRYADFVAKPDPSWCATSRQARFIPSVQRGFRDWVINPDWLPFDASRAAGAENEIDGNVWKREIRIVTQFLNYYLKDVGTNRLNVAKAPLSHLLLKHPTAREIISDVAIADMIKQVQRYVPGYKLVNGPVFDGNRVSIFMEVEGLGDYLPKYAGNLDIMTAAAARTAEMFAEAMLKGELTLRASTPQPAIA